MHVDACPLCGEAAFRKVSSIPAGVVLNNIKKIAGPDTAEALSKYYDGMDDFAAVECSSCRMLYYKGAQTADMDFYELLQGHSDYYRDAQMWEYHQALSWISVQDKVLDVGCGNGAFLRRAALIAKEAAGLETNIKAAELARAGGFRVFSDAIELVCAENQECFTLVCCFQVVEHVGDVRAFVACMLRCLKRGGRLIITVPNKDRVGKKNLDFMDMPPHHVSLWSGDSLMKLGELSGVTVVKVGKEPADLRSMRFAIRRYFARLLKIGDEASNYSSYPLRAASAALLPARFYNYLGRKDLVKRMGWHGHSLLAVYEK